MIDIYVISLEKSLRWPRQKEMLDRLGLEAHQWPAVDGRATPLKDLEQHWIDQGVLLPNSDIVNCKDRGDPYKQSVIGLMASTALLWRHLQQFGQEWTLILEDDCELHPNLGDPRYFDLIWSFLPEDAEFVYFGCQMTQSMINYWQPHVGKNEAITAVCQDVNPFFVRIQRSLFGAYAYAVRKSVLPKLLSAFPMTSAIDNFLPSAYAIYAIKSPCDWWNKLPHADSSHVFWGLAAPRPGKSTITD